MTKLSLRLRKPFVSSSTTRVGFCSSAALAQAHEITWNSLYRQISKVGEATATIVPVIEQWAREGRGKVEKKNQFQHAIKELRRNGRINHALEVSQWMGDKMRFELSAGDVAVRFCLINEVHGAEQADKYLDIITKQSEQMETYAHIHNPYVREIHVLREKAKHLETYTQILNYYAREKCVVKAEAVMNKVRDLGLDRATIFYNAMINFYRQINSLDKLDAIVHDMEEKGIKFDKFTFSLLLSCDTDSLDCERVEKIVRKMETEPDLALDFDVYIMAANNLIKAGLNEKAFEMVKKSEGFITTENKSASLDLLLMQYAEIGKRDEVLRIWNLIKQKSKIYNRNYINVLISLLVKLDDIETAEKIFEEWECSGLSYDFRIPNFLIGFYCRKGLIEKAEAFIERAKLKGGIPTPPTFYYLAVGYINVKEMEKAVEAMNTAISSFKRDFKPGRFNLVACLEYLKEKGDIEKSEEFMKVLLSKNVVSTDVYDKVLDSMKKGDDIEMKILIL